MWKNLKLYFREAHQQLKETSNIQAQNTTYHANAMRELVNELRAEIQSTQQINATIEHDSQPPPATSISEASIDLSILALQSKLASLKDCIHIMQQNYQVLPQPQPYPQPPVWNSPYCMPT